MTIADIPTSPQTVKPGLARSVRRWHPAVILSAAFLVLALLAALFPSIFTNIDPNAGNAKDTLVGPSLDHFFGTDQNGRDIFSRVVHGARPSLLIGISASAIALIAGSAIGVISARGGKVTDEIASRLLDVLLSIPGVLLILLIITVRGPGTTTTIIGVSLVTIPGYARVVRGETIRVRNSVFVEAARALGWSNGRVILRHVVPNALGPVLVLATIGIGSSIGVSSSLSFLGLGPQPPTAEWGSMLSSSRDYFAVAWWPAIFPGLAITLTVLTVTVVGQFLQKKNEGRVVS